MNLVRLWEKLTGTQHKHQLAAQVAMSASELSNTARELNSKLLKYKMENDPMTAMIANVYEARQESSIYKGGVP